MSYQESYALCIIPAEKLQTVNGKLTCPGITCLVAAPVFRLVAKEMEYRHSCHYDQLPDLFDTVAVRSPNSYIGTMLLSSKEPTIPITPGGPPPPPFMLYV